jgi:hypothetical protein
LPLQRLRGDRKTRGCFSVSASAAATSASATVKTTSPAATAAAGPAALRLGTSFVHIYGSAFYILTIHASYRGISLGFGRHFYKSEPSGFSGKPVSYDVDGADLAESLKSLTQIILCYIA